MALQRKFLHPKIDVLDIPKIRLFGGIFIGIFYSVIWYALMFLFREAMKLFTIDDFYSNYLALTESETFFYNLFFAFISVILGFSAMVEFWLKSPRKSKEKYYRRRVSIINDQRNLNWTFMLIFSRIATIFGFLSISMFSVGYELFSFHNDYYYVFILAIIVLFLNTWNSTRHLFKNKSLKWMFLSASIISIFSFSLANINLIDVEAYNNVMLKNNISYQYNIKTPTSDNYRTIEDRSLTLTMYIALSKENKNESLIFFPYYTPSNLEQISSVIEAKKLNFEERLRDRLIVRLIIDKNVKMGIINEVKGKIINTGHLKIAYEITPDENFKALGRVFPQRLPSYSYEHYLESKEVFASQNINYIKITPNVNNEYLINNQSYSKDEIKPILRDIILTQEKYLLEYFINDEMTFDHYLQFHITYRSELRKVWNEYSQEKYQKDYNELTRQFRVEVQKEYPLVIYDISKNMIEGNSPKLGGDMPPPPPLYF